MPVCSIVLLMLLLEPGVDATTAKAETPVLVEPPRPRAPKPPSDGGGAIVTGSVMILAGLAMASGSIVQAARPDSPGEGLLALGAILVGAGGPGVLMTGVKTRRMFRTTELGRAVGGPTTGRAMQAGSLLAFAAGSLGLLAGVWRLRSPCPNCIEPPSDALILIGTGPGLMTAGAIMFTISQANRAKYRKWMQDRPTRIQPTVAFGPGTMQLGLAGRF